MKNDCYDLFIQVQGFKRKLLVETQDKSIQISIDDTSGLPIWLQLRNRIVYLIVSGHFKPDDRLPTVRELAVDLGINYNTVTKVYSDIEKDGYIVSRRGRGTFVADREIDSDEATQDVMESLADDFIRQCRELGMPRKDIVDLLNSRLYQAD